MRLLSPKTPSYGAPMQADAAQRATQAALSSASSLGLTVYDAVVLHNSNRLTLRLLPCDVLAQVAPAAHQGAQLEVDIAQRLCEARNTRTSVTTAGGVGDHSRTSWKLIARARDSTTGERVIVRSGG